MKYNKMTINQTTVHLIQTNKFKTVAMQVRFQNKLDQATVAQRGLLPFVLRSGTAKYPSSAAIQQQLEYLYGASFHVGVEKKGSLHTQYFNFSCVNDKFLPAGQTVLADVFAFLGEVLYAPKLTKGSFDPQVVEQEKRLLIDKIRGIYDDKLQYSLMRLVEEMGAGEPFAIRAYGTIEDVSAITPEQLYATYQSMLTQDELEIYLVGDITPEQVETLILTHLQAAGAEHYESRSRSEKVITEVKHLSEAQAVTQAKLILGYRTHTYFGDENFFALRVMNGILGGYTHSKLFLNVREKASLCYFAASRIDGNAGIMYLYSGLDHDKVSDAEKLIIEQIDAVQAGQFSDHDLEMTKLAMKNDVLEILDSATGMMSFYASINDMGVDWNVEQWLQAIDAVTREQVITAANALQADTTFVLTSQEA
ncbi:MAG: EF-P 5-aminopentanol modification-associated protein YfmF [Culicoidibacterales bacterium]